MTERDLEKYYLKYGKVKLCTIIKDQKTGYNVKAINPTKISKKFSFVEFETKEEADYALRKTQDIEFFGKKLYVEKSNRNNGMERRGGGGEKYESYKRKPHYNARKTFNRYPSKSPGRFDKEKYYRQNNMSG